MPIICGICFKEIFNGPAKKKFHSGACAEIAHRRRCREYCRTHPERRKPIELTCRFCGIDYTTTTSNSVCCRDQKCQNAYRRELAKRKWDALSTEERIAYRKKKYKASPMAAGQYKNVPASEILCKCPGCGTWHIKRFEYGFERKPGSTPLFNCSNFPGCVHNNIGTVIYSVYAGGNEARI